MAATDLAMKSRHWLPLRVLAVSMRTGIISAEGRISVATEAPRAKPSGYSTVFFVQVPYRVPSPDIMMVDWPATAGRSGEMVKVNTLTTVRKVEGRWLITSYLESVPYTRPIGGWNATPSSP